MKNKFYKGRSDIVFKGIFLKDSNRDMLKRLIEESINKKVEILEVNSYSDVDLHKRNASYIFERYSSPVPIGGSYSDMKNFIQINLTYVDPEKGEDLEMISEYHFEEIYRHEDYINNLTIYEYNVSKIKKEYNGDRTHGIMALLDADASEFETIGTGD